MLRAELLRFAARSANDVGFGNLDVDGRLVTGGPTELYVTCRMTYVFCLGIMAGEPAVEGGPTPEELRALAAHGVDALLDGPLRDHGAGGWFYAVPDKGRKSAYAHAFVILAASAGVQAGIPGAEELLDQAAHVHLKWFFDEGEGLVVDDWDSAWTRCDPYRGLNSNMHTVEAYLAAGDATEDTAWHDRALGIARRVVAWASDNRWRIPEHFSASWEPLLDYNRDQPNHPFRPFGATIGHGLEWARLLVGVAQAVGQERGSDLTEAAVALADRAVEDGWARDGADGLVYTVDWEGTPVSQMRMHWVICEAIAASAVLAEATGDALYEAQLERWWRYADHYLIDRDRGSWRHELDAQNRPSFVVWSGKPDVYHAYQACLVQDVPLAPSFAEALRRGSR